METACISVVKRLTDAPECQKDAEADRMTDNKWDELIESFEVMKYGGDKDDPQRVLEKDIRSSECKRDRGLALLFAWSQQH
jgi:hypothetical protein